MVDFKKLSAKKKKDKVINPIEIFRRLPKPTGINDLYISQADVLNTWFDKRQDVNDVILKLHTGGGKTLVGLLIAQSTLNETGGPVLYLTPTVQLVNQTIEKASAIGIAAVKYESGQQLDDDFIDGKAIMVGTYKALFNGRSKFGVRGVGAAKTVSALILDDAHVAFSIIRDSFTLEIKKDDPLYCELSTLFRKAFKDIDRLGTFDDIVDGSEYATLEVPYWSWHEQLGAVRELLKRKSGDFAWPLLRDNLHLCHALISNRSFTITPILPLVNMFPTFSDAPRRIYMSATIADDSEIIRTFDVGAKAANEPLVSRSLAGISERMILVPELMPFNFDIKTAAKEILEETKKNDLGSIILVSSESKATEWTDVAEFAKGSTNVERCVMELQEKSNLGPIVFANRYDGIDLPGESCRLLVMNGLPSGTSNYELLRETALHGGKTITRLMAQRIEQGMGRAARGAGDFCVVMLIGPDLSSWIAKNSNYNYLTSATRAQLEIGIEVSKEVSNENDLKKIIEQCYERDKDWVEYHAETLAELITDDSAEELHFKQAETERKSFTLWQDGYYQKAITNIDAFLSKEEKLDSQSRGWLEQLAARIANHWGNKDLAEDKQRSAFANNRNLTRPKIMPPYSTLPIPESQAKAIVENIGNYRQRRGYINNFEKVASFLNSNSSANQFEQALCDFAKIIGLASERHDNNGEGPDVLWLLPNNVGFVVEAKSRKKEGNALTKVQHGQLLVAAEWFEKNYPDYEYLRISVHPKNKATKAAVAGASHALTYEKLAAFVSDARILLSGLCESHLKDSELLGECTRLLSESDIKFDKIANRYLTLFEEVE